jgi:ribosomal protein S18 acetylase RimI-like enzyme
VTTAAQTHERIGARARRLAPEDAGELLTLQLAAWVREGRVNGTIEIPPLQDGLDDVLGALRDPAQTIWGYREDSGRLIATVRTSQPVPGTGFIARLGVVPDRMRAGIGSAMLRLAESRLPVQVRRLELVTGLHSVDNHAFYARHGYHIVARDPDGGIVRLAKDRQSG